MFKNHMGIIIFYEMMLRHWTTATSNDKSHLNLLSEDTVHTLSASQTPANTKKAKKYVMWLSIVRTEIHFDVKFINFIKYNQQKVDISLNIFPGITILSLGSEFMDFIYSIGSAYNFNY